MASHAELTGECGGLVTMDDATTSDADEIARRIAEAGKRAAAEAEERRAKAQQKALPKEIGGPKGLEPTRYGDWEVNGIASDF